MFNHLDVVETLTCDIQHKENIPVETYQLSYTVRNKLVRKNFRKLKIEGANDKRSQREGVSHFKF